MRGGKRKGGEGRGEEGRGGKKRGGEGRGGVTVTIYLMTKLCLRTSTNAL
jgi:hypothetical protein